MLVKVPVGNAVLHGHHHSLWAQKPGNVQQFQETEAAMAHFKGVRGGKLSVGVISAGDYYFPRLLVDFMRRHAGATLDFAVYNRQELLGRLADNLTVLAVMVRPPLNAATVNEAFAPHPYVILASPGHPLAGKPRIPLARLAGEPFVVREKGSECGASAKQAPATRGPGLQGLPDPGRRRPD